MTDSATGRRLQLIRAVDEKLRLYPETVLTLLHRLHKIFPMAREPAAPEKAVEDFLLDGGEMGNRDIIVFLRLATSVKTLFAEWSALCAEFAKMPAEYRENVVHNDIVDHFVKCKNEHGLEVARKMAGPYTVDGCIEFDAHEVHLIVSMSPFVRHLRGVTVSLLDGATILQIAGAMGSPIPCTSAKLHGVVEVSLTDITAVYLKAFAAFHHDEKQATAGILPVNAALLVAKTPAAFGADELKRLVEETRRLRAEQEDRVRAIEEQNPSRLSDSQPTNIMTFNKAAIGADELKRLIEENQRLKAEHEARACAIAKMIDARAQEP